MNEDRFWTIIQESRDAAVRTPLKDEEFSAVHRKTLEAAVRKLTTEELVDFNERFRELSVRAYRWDVWGAAYWQEGGCSDDGFEKFRACLISLGREWYERILKNPDELAGVLGRKDVPYLQSERFLYIASRIYRERTGKELPASEVRRPADPAGEDFDFDDRALMKKRYPTLTARMPTPGGD